ncbi:MAG: rhomboid family intramembrane serine protease, partial [Clostridiales bacterium]|nr:rhomboid family intramembrane serine protease [Clostridiales bacterium]
MSSAFSEKFFKMLVDRGYKALGASGGLDPAAAVLWAASKAENADLCVVQTADCDRDDLSRVLNGREEMLRRNESVLPHFSHIIILYVLVSENETPRLAELNKLTAFAQPYDAQPVYEIFWHAQLDAQTITAPEGQPTEIFGVAKLIRAAMKAAADSPEPLAPRSTFREIQEQQRKTDPYKPKHANAFCVYLIAAANAVVLILMYLNGYPGDPYTAMRFGAIVPEFIFSGGEYYRLFTAMFVHFGAAHLLMNLFGLIVFGAMVERYYGRIKFLLIYFISGICGSVASLLLTRGYAAGASGAIYGVTGAMLAYSLVTKRPMNRLTAFNMVVYAAVGLTFGFMTPGIDNFAHLGG